MKYRTTYDAIGDATAVDGVIDVSPEVAAALGLGEPIGKSAPPAPEKSTVETFLEQTAAAIIAIVKDVPADRLAELQAVRDAEASESGKQRSTVLAAIDARLEELTAPPE